MTKEKTPMAAYRVAIIGTGAIAEAHIQALKMMKERIQVIAAMDIDRARVETFCQKHAIPRAYTDESLLLAEEHPDLIHIATPPSLHYHQIMNCLIAGAWVLCEKPLCTSLAQLDQIARVEQLTGKYCSSVFQWRCGSGAQHLKRLIQEQAMGRPLVGICQTTWYRDQAYFQVPWRGKWATEGGGPTMGHGIHAMDLFLWLLGEWEEISAMRGTLDRTIEVEDVSMATLRFQSGALGSIVNSVLSPRQKTYLRFDFQKATVELTGLYSYSNTDWHYSVPEQVQAGDELEKWQTIPSDIPSSHTTQLAMLLDCMDRNERPLASTADVRSTLECITALYKSSATGHTVQRGSIDQEDPFYWHVAGYRE